MLTFGVSSCEGAYTYTRKLVLQKNIKVRVQAAAPQMHCNNCVVSSFLR